SVDCEVDRTREVRVVRENRTVLVEPQPEHDRPRPDEQPRSRVRPRPRRRAKREPGDDQRERPCDAHTRLDGARSHGLAATLCAWGVIPTRWCWPPHKGAVAAAHAAATPLASRT